MCPKEPAERGSAVDDRHFGGKVAISITAEAMTAGRALSMSHQVGQAQEMVTNSLSQYATGRNLALRQRLWSTSQRVPDFDLVSWVLDQVGVTPSSTESVLDVGCGNGPYERALAGRGHRGLRVAVDLSAGMLRLVTDAPVVQADVQSLPFPPSCFDLVLAPHMLYHVPDIEAAANEIGRVLRPHGIFLAVTNGRSHLQELRTLVESAVGTDWRMRRSSQRFSMENGAGQLSPAFRSVVRLDCPPSHLLVTDVNVLTDYVASVADPYQSQVDIPWSEVVNRVHELASGVMSGTGQLRLNTGVGAFVCRGRRL